MLKHPRRKIAAEYLRRSDEKQEQSLADQAKESLRVAEAHGLKLIKTFDDDGISGATAEGRPGFMKMIEEGISPNREWDFLICYDLSRFGRMETDEKAHYRHLLKKAGVEIIYSGENLPPGRLGALYRTFRDVESSEFLVQLSKVVLRGMLSVVQAGWWIGPAPLGFDLQYFDGTGKPLFQVRHTEYGEKQVISPDGIIFQTLPLGQPIIKGQNAHGKLVPSLPERVALAGRIFRLALDRGPQSIASILNAEKLPSPRAFWPSRKYQGVWTASTIAQILRNRAYIGDSIWNCTNVGKFHRVVGKQAVAKDDMSEPQRKHNPKEDWIIVEGTHPPLIDPALFRQVNEMMDARSKKWTERGIRSGRAKNSPFLLSGLIRCARCDHPFHGQSKWCHYICGGYIEGGNGTCRRTTFKKAAFEQNVIGFLKKRVDQLLSREGLDALTRKATEQLGSSKTNVREELSRLNTQRADILKRTKSWQLLDESNRELINSDLAKLKSELSEIDGRIAALREEDYAPPHPEQLTKLIAGHLRRFESLMQGGALEDQKAFIRTLVDKITLDPVTRDAVLWVRPIPDLRLPGGIASFEGGKGLLILLEKMLSPLEQFHISTNSKA